MRFKAVVMVIAVMCVAGLAHADETGLSFADFVNGVRPENNTSLGAKAFWRANYKQRVTWSGEVVDVRGRGRGAEIHLSVSGYPLYRGYNIVLQVADRTAAGVLKPGDTLKFRGQLHRYKARLGHPTIVYISNGQLLNAMTTAPATDGDPLTDFVAFTKKLSLENNTKVAADVNWQSLKLQSVTWQAVVVDVKGGRSAADIYLAAPNAPLYRGYNIILDNSDLGQASLLKKGQQVMVKGTPARYTNRVGRPMVVTLRFGEIITAQ